ncbi:ATP-binding protein, partial [Bifidobacterium longum]|uniref:ATP-binding protein n=2 Tax=Bifidobacterium longum TaxID=216816 RepID=UPI001EDA4F1A
HDQITNTTQTGSGRYRTPCGKPAAYTAEKHRSQSGRQLAKTHTVFADDKLAAAIIDRIVHHGRLLEFTGQSRRVSEALMFGRNTSAQPEK